MASQLQTWWRWMTAVMRPWGRSFTCPMCEESHVVKLEWILKQMIASFKVFSRHKMILMNNHQIFKKEIPFCSSHSETLGGGCGKFVHSSTNVSFHVNSCSAICPLEGAVCWLLFLLNALPIQYLNCLLQGDSSAAEHHPRAHSLPLQTLRCCIHARHVAVAGQCMHHLRLW